MSDLDAIREDVAMAARSAEMARHVALDHAPELLDQIESLKSDVEVLAGQRETLWDALEQVLHVGLHDGMEWETVEQIVKDGPGKFDVLALLERLDPSPRRVETAEELDALPFLTIVREVFNPSPVAGCDYGGVWERRTSGWECIAAGYFDQGRTALRLPATVLWTPEGEQ